MKKKYDKLYVYIEYRTFIVVFYNKENGVLNMKRFFSQLKSFFSKKPVIVVLVVFALIALAIVIYSLFIYDNDNDDAIVYENYTIASGHVGKLEKYDPSYTVDGYKGSTDEAYYITGNITASEDKDFTVVTFNLYDEKNNFLGTAVGGVKEVKKGKTYSFRAIALVDDEDTLKIDHYKIKSIELGN